MPDESSQPAALGSIFDGGAASSPTPSTESKDTSTASTDKTETTDEKASSDATDKTGTTESDSSKVEDKPKSDEVEDESALSDEEKAAKATEKAATAEKAKADKVVADKKAADDAATAEQATFKKRFEDTANWARQVNQDNLRLKQQHEEQAQQLAILQKKVDGTWSEEDEAAAAAPYKPEAVAAQGVLMGKVSASKASAVRDFGNERVEADLSEFHQMFNDNQAVQMAVRSSDSPIHEAMDVMERFRFQTKYGPKPTEWVKNIKAEHEKELRVSIRKELLDEIKAGKATKDKSPGSLASIVGGKGDEGKLKEATHTPLKDLF